MFRPLSPSTQSLEIGSVEKKNLSWVTAPGLHGTSEKKTRPILNQSNNGYGTT